MTVNSYRIEELSVTTGTTVRTVQSYRNKGLLPPPRREGRVALYSDDHVERLELIADLIGRGYSLNAVAELLDGLGRGDRIHDLIGLGDVLDRRTPPPSVVSADEIATAFGGADAIVGLCDVGIIEPDDQPDHYRIVLPAAYEVGIELLASGVPRLDVVRAARDVQRQVQQIADGFVYLVADHVVAEEPDHVGDGEGADADEPTSTVTDLVARLVPLAEGVATDYLRVAMDRRIRTEVERQIGILLTADAGADD